MEYVYAALILHETGEEINEDNLSAVLEAAGADVEDSRVKALVAALEDVDIEEAVEQAAAVPAAATGAAPAQAEEGGPEAAEAEEAGGEEAADDEEPEEDEEVSGEGLGDLFG